MTAATNHQGAPPWGFWATLLWAVGAVVASFVAAVLVDALVTGGVSRASSLNDGVNLSILLLASMPVQAGVLVFAVWLRGWSLSEYLALVPPRGRRDLLTAIVFLVLLDGAFTLVQLTAGRDLLSPFQIEAYQTAKAAGWLPGLIFVMVVLAPVVEEITFRGFLYRGWARPGREILAIVGISVLFAAGHVQYDWFGMLQVLFLGFVFGWFRWVSGSTALTIAMHMFVNLVSVIETAIKVELLS